MVCKLTKRITREVSDISKIQDACMKLEFKSGDNVTELRGEIAGPLETVYEGGNFVLDISLPEQYPLSPPLIKFATNIWHPNIDSKTGKICLDILKDAWSACMTLRTVMLSLQCLLSSPEAGDALDEFAAKQHVCHNEVFKQTARHWTNVFAGGSNREPELEQKIEEMKAFGVEEDKARFALSNAHWDINGAIASFASD